MHMGEKRVQIIWIGERERKRKSDLIVCEPMTE